ncbi:type IV toxin-antitoxin system AbiEi family antitoxin domain-containing protein [Olsenella sp. An290]|uniref:type IV toxin-antitoxin system AbiEi family antitoxin domain-containing protein n=1 Tax=Olsenella sp. An290 TaxID=1965625 RepID=UPI0019513C33|nr:type IV toxin-antitoxin system AbiEi family antitoxin domain-containing protein [Olsenella sp. An290]
MSRQRQTPFIDSLSASEGVFTTAQAARVGISRSALAKACNAGKLVRLAHGAYRSAAVTSSPADEIAAAWKLTSPEKMLHERMAYDAWDGIVVGGTTAASLIGIGDFFLTPICMYAPRRLKTRNPDVRISVRQISREDVDFGCGFAATKPERTIIDLVLDDEELSLVRDAYHDAQEKGLDLKRLRAIVEGLTPGRARKVRRAFEECNLHDI